MRRVVVIIFILTQLAGVSAQTGWVTLGRGCCADSGGVPLTNPLVTLTGITSAGACRSAGDANPLVDSAEYEKNTETCKLFANGLTVTYFEDFYGCLATKRCLKYYSSPPTMVPSGLPTDVPAVPPTPSPAGAQGRVADDPNYDEDDSNFSFQQGSLDYLASYFLSQRPTFGIVAGKAALLRRASGSAKISVSFKVGLSLTPNGVDLSELAAMQFPVRLHSETCANDGGDVYQNPYICLEESGGRCPQLMVELSVAAGSPLEVDFNVTVNTNDHNEAIAEHIWNVHIPNEYQGQSYDTLSIVVYDPVTGRPMACADMEDDRDTDGILYFINTQDTSLVPVMTGSLLSRTERGSTDLSMSVLNLPTTSTFRLYVHSLPCVPLPGVSTSAQTRGGDVYMRDISCYGRVGDLDCDPNDPDSTIFIEFQGSGSGVSTDVSASYPTLTRADAASLILYLCDDSNGCGSSSDILLTCVDMLNDATDLASTSSVRPAIATPSPSTSSPTTQSPTTQSPTTATPTTGTPTTGTPTTGTPTTGAPAAGTPNTSAPSTLAPSTSSPTTPAPTAPGGGDVVIVDDGSGMDGEYPNDRTNSTGDSGSGGQNGGGGDAGSGSYLDSGVAYFDEHCPNIHVEYQVLVSKRGKKGSSDSQLKKKRIPLESIRTNRNDYGKKGKGREVACCLDAVPPNGLHGFYFSFTTEAYAYNTSALVLVVLTTGVTFFVAGLIMIVRKYRLKSAGYLPVADDVYATPLYKEVDYSTIHLGSGRQDTLSV